ncbi:MAG: response regulator [Chloroflexi bacterium]|nr:response regulator [Chloroflexota bacterium]
MSDQPSTGGTRRLDSANSGSSRRLQPVSFPAPDAPRRAWAVSLMAINQSIPFQMQIDSSATIGRADPDTDYWPEIDLAPLGALERGVSRRHAELQAGEEFLVVVDLNSTNGTRLNEHRLQPDEPYQLQHGDILTIGTIALSVQIALMPVHDGIKLVKKQGTGMLGRTRDGQKPNTRRQILIVEDDPETSAMFARMIQTLGYETHEVHRTGDAMRYIAQRVPDGVLVDLHMPDYPGTEICQMIKSDLANVEVPIMIVSGDTDDQTIRSAFEAGADVFLSKPLGMDELLDSLQSFVGTPIIQAVG